VHELGYCESILDAVERRAAGRRVARVGVRVGVLHRVLPSAFQQSFQLVAAGTVAEGATTDVLTVPARATCPECGTGFETLDPVPVCPSCGTTVLDTDGGNELVLEWIEYHPIEYHRIEYHQEEGPADVPGDPR
jgi:hydrogenase nickel incorporation protein HypA/HybF